MNPYKYIYYFNLNFVAADIEEYSELVRSRKIEKNIVKAISESLQIHKNEITDYTSQIIRFDSIEFDYDTESGKAIDMFCVKLKSKRNSSTIGSVVNTINEECLNKIKDKFPHAKFIPGVTRIKMNSVK